jgi:hypothetical protein
VLEVRASPEAALRPQEPASMALRLVGASERGFLAAKIVDAIEYKS